MLKSVSRTLLRSNCVFEFLPLFAAEATDVEEDGDRDEK